VLNGIGAELALHDHIGSFARAKPCGFNGAAEVIKHLFFDIFELVLVQRNGKGYFGVGSGDDIGFHSVLD